MENTELTRERHKPDWLCIFAGVTATFASMGTLSMAAHSLRLAQIHPTDSRRVIVMEAFWMIFSVIASIYTGAYLAGRLMSTRGRVAATMNGLLVWELSVILFGLLGYLGFQILPGVIFSAPDIREAPEGQLWMVMQLGLPLPFAAAFGAMAGNDHVKGPVVPNEKLPKRPPPEEIRYDKAA